MKRIIGFSIIIIGCILGYWWWQNGSVSAEIPTTNLVAMLSEPANENFARATEPDAIQFPRDLGAHNDYQTEWWYYTGNLSTETGREFGYQFTIFRSALAPETNPPQDNDSAWRTQQIYLVHFTVSDIDGGEFYFTERYSRGGAGLAGAQADPYRVWVEDWGVAENAAGEVFVSAESDTHAIDLTLTQTLPPILHGEGGLSAKSFDRGNASYYYSQIQQKTTGTVTVAGETFAITGKSWKDHEYSTSVLKEEAEGWDWVSLQFDDGSALMLFQIRYTDGSIEPASSGTFIAPDGTTTPLVWGDWTMETTDTWTSANTDATYPVGWTITLPTLDLTLTGAAKMPAQELTLTSGSYWEGAVSFSGTKGNAPLQGNGYIEMTGYADSNEP